MQSTVWIFFEYFYGLLRQAPILYLRIYHECEGGIEKSEQRLNVWHHEACWVMANSNQEGCIFLSYPHMNKGFFFLLAISYRIFIFEKREKCFQRFLNTLRFDIQMALCIILTLQWRQSQIDLRVFVLYLSHGLIGDMWNRIFTYICKNSENHDLVRKNLFSRFLIYFLCCEEWSKCYTHFVCN